MRNPSGPGRRTAPNERPDTCQQSTYPSRRLTLASAGRTIHATEFRNGRELAAWLGLVPRQRSTGGRAKLLGISKRGDRHLRTLLIHGARASLRYAPQRTDRRSRWALATEQRRGRNIAAVALANKNARTAWAVLARGRTFDAGHIARAA